MKNDSSDYKIEREMRRMIIGNENELTFEERNGRERMEKSGSSMREE